MMQSEPSGSAKLEHPPPTSLGVPSLGSTGTVWVDFEPSRALEGYIKLHRAMRDDGLYQSFTDLQKLAWIHFLLEVNWKPSEFGCSKCGKLFKLPAGATAKSLDTLAQGIGLGRQVVRGMLDRATKHGSITRNIRARCHSIYVVENWHKYQWSNTPLTHPQHTLNTPSTSEEEGKKERRAAAPAKKPSRKAAQELPKKGKPYTERSFKSLPDFALCCYYEEYQQRHGQPPQVDWQGRDRVVMSKLCSGPPSRDRGQMQTLVCNYLDSREDFLIDAGHPIALLPSRVNVLQGHQKPKRRMPDVLQPVDWKAIREGKQ